jgi:hypothetical protein
MQYYGPCRHDSEENEQNQPETKAGEKAPQESFQQQKLLLPHIDRPKAETWLILWRSLFKARIFKRQKFPVDSYLIFSL